MYENENDRMIACNVIAIVFKNINQCVQNDRSKVKLGMIEKGIISGMIGSKTLVGINNYVNNMYPLDVKVLMDEIETEMKKRKH